MGRGAVRRRHAISGDTGGGPSPLPSYDQLILAAGPVLYLPLINTTDGLTDLSGRGHHATAVGSPTVATTGPGDGRGSVRFSGSVGNYLAVADHDDLSVPTTGALTVEAWVSPSTLEPEHPEGPGPDYTQPLGKLQYGGNCEWEVRLYKATTPGESPERPNRFSVYAFNAGCGLGTGSYFQDDLSVDEWVHVVGVINMEATSALYPTGYVRVYKGGVLRDVDALDNFGVVPSNTTSPMHIGAASLDSWFAGRVARVAVYPYELSAEVIRSHYRHLVPASPGTITHQRHIGSGTATTASTTMHVNVPASGVPAGTTLICRVAHGYTSGFPTMADVKGNTYVRDYTTPDDGNTIRTSLFRAHIVAPLFEGDDITVTLTASVSPRVIVVDAFEDVSFTGALIQANSDSGNSTGPTDLDAPAVVTSVADAAVIAVTAVAGPTSDTYTPDTARDYTTLARAGVTGLTVNTEWKSINQTGTYIDVPVLGTSRIWSQIIAAYKAGPTQPPAQDYDGLLLAAGPVAYWNLNGTTDGILDQTGNGHTATMLGGTPVTSTGIGDGKSSLLFDGIDDRLEIADAADLSIPTTGTIALELWMSPAVLQFPTSEPATHDYVHVAGKNRYDDRSEYELRMYNLTTPGENPPRPNRISGYAFNAVGGLGTGSYFQDTVAVDEWVHVVCIFTTASSAQFPQGYTRIYKNGVLRDTDDMRNFSVVPSNTTAPFNIGTAALDSFFKGRVAKVAVWNREPSAAEIQARYQRANPPVPPPPQGTPEFQRHVGSATATASGTTSTVTLTEAVPEGHTLFVHAVADFTSNAITVTDSKSNVYTRDRSAPDAANTIRASTFSARVTTALAAGDTITVTWPAAVTRRAVAVNSWTKLAYPIVVDSTNGTTGTNASPLTSGTTTYGDTLLLAAVFTAGPTGDTFSNDTARSWTSLTRVGTSGAGTATDDRTINAAWRSVPTAGTYTYGPTLGTARTHIVQLLSYRASTFSPSPPPVGSGSHVKHLGAATATTSGSSLTLTVTDSGGGRGRPASREATNAGLKIPTSSLIPPTLPISGMTGSGTVRNIVSPGTYEGYDFPGALNILSDNVTVRNCRWNNFADFWAISSEGRQNVVIEDCQINGGSGHGIDGWNWTARRVLFFDLAADPLDVGSASGSGTPTIIEDCCAFDFKPGPLAHCDGVQQWVSGLDTLIIRRCWIELVIKPGYSLPDEESGFTSPVFCQSYPETGGPQGITLVEDNVLDSEDYHAIRWEGPDELHGAITCRPAALRNRMRANPTQELILGGVPYEGEGNITWDGTPYHGPNEVPVRPGLPTSAEVGAETAQAGQTVVLRVVSDYSAALPSATDSKANAYTLDKTVTDPANGIRVSILSGRITTALVAGDTITVSLGATTARRAVTADVFAGILHPIVVDRSATASGSSATPAVSLSTVNADDVLVAAVGVAGPSSDGFTEDTAHSWSALTAAGTTGAGSPSQDRTIRSVWRSVGAPRTFTYTPTLAPSRAWAAAVVSYKAG